MKQEQGQDGQAWRQGLDSEMVKDLHQPTTSFPGTYRFTGIFLGSFHTDVRDCFSSHQYQPTPTTSWNTLKMLMLDSDWDRKFKWLFPFPFIGNCTEYFILLHVSWKDSPTLKTQVFGFHFYIKTIADAERADAQQQCQLRSFLKSVPDIVTGSSSVVAFHSWIGVICGRTLKTWQENSRNVQAKQLNKGGCKTILCLINRWPAIWQILWTTVRKLLQVRWDLPDNLEFLWNHIKWDKLSGSLWSSICEE